MKRALHLNEKIFALCQEKGLTYREACAELGRRGAAARANKRRHRISGVALLERRGLW